MKKAICAFIFAAVFLAAAPLIAVLLMKDECADKCAGLFHVGGLLFFGVVAFVLSIWYMKTAGGKNGFGPFNTRIVGIIVVATIAGILGIVVDHSGSAAFGILGAILGYLFGDSNQTIVNNNKETRQ